MADDARIAALETAVSELRQELDLLRKGRTRSMRETYRCPACGGAKILHFTRIKELSHGGMIDLALQKQWSTWWGVKLSAAPLEAFVCRNCRLVEWHAISVDEVEPDGNEVVELDGNAHGRAMDPGPYR
jgi:hypothetical protein